MSLAVIGVILLASLAISFFILSVYLYKALQDSRANYEGLLAISRTLNRNASMRITVQCRKIEKLTAENRRLKNVSGCSMFGLCGYGFSQN